MNNAMLWHKRLGHVSHRGLTELAKQGLLGDKKLQEMEFCETFVYGKTCKVKFGIGVQRTKGTLDYIDLDLWGPSRTQSLSGARYFMTLVDDYSRKLWIFILKHKSDALEKFKQWKFLIENRLGKNVQRLRTNNGMEYCSKDFEKFCKDEGIVRHKTTVGTPQ